MLMGIAGVPFTALRAALTIGHYHEDFGEPVTATLDQYGRNIANAIGSIGAGVYDGGEITECWFESYYNSAGSDDYESLILVRNTDTSAIYPYLDDTPIVGNSQSGATATWSISSGVNPPSGFSPARRLLMTLGSATLGLAIRTDLITATGASSVTVPNDCTQLIVIALGAGGGGGRRSAGACQAGAAGGYALKTLSVPTSQWGTTLNYSVGAKGIGRTGSSGAGTAGGNTTVTHAGLDISITCNGGAGGAQSGSGTSAGGTASGGDTNITGGNGTVSTGGAAVGNGATGQAYQGKSAGGNGGASANANGSDGEDGIVALLWR